MKGTSKSLLSPSRAIPGCFCYAGPGGSEAGNLFAGELAFNSNLATKLHTGHSPELLMPVRQ